MALLPNVFIPDDAEENPFAPLPAGWYEAEIIKSELKTTKDGNGKYIALSFKILEGENEGRLVYTNLNIVNKSDVAVKIARADLKAICGAIGHEGELEDTEDLHNTPMAIKLSLKQETANWPAKNEIKSFKDSSELESDENPLG